MLALTLTEWKELAETTEHFSVALGVLIGGGWTLYTFIRLRHVAKARLEVEEKIKELHESAVLEATINARQIAVGTDAHFHISAVVSVVNVGNTDTAIKYAETEFFVSEANIDEHGVTNYVTVASGTYPHPQKIGPIGTTIPPKYTFRWPCVFKVKKAGLFLITFKAKCVGEANESIKKFMKDNPKNETFCTAYSFIVLK